MRDCLRELDLRPGKIEAIALWPKSKRSLYQLVIGQRDLRDALLDGSLRAKLHLLFKNSDESNRLLSKQQSASSNYPPINRSPPFSRIMTDDETYALIEDRTRELAQWLEQESPYVQFDQRHLDSGSQQQAYWHLGYVSALRDVLVLLKDETVHRPDTTSSSPAADPDE